MGQSRHLDGYASYWAPPEGDQTARDFQAILDGAGERLDLSALVLLSGDVHRFYFHAGWTEQGPDYYAQDGIAALARRLGWALDVFRVPAREMTPEKARDGWRFLRRHVDAGRPVIVSGVRSRRPYLVTGYDENARTLTSPRTDLTPVDAARWLERGKTDRGLTYGPDHIADLLIVAAARMEPLRPETDILREVIRAGVPSMRSAPALEGGRVLGGIRGIEAMARSLRGSPPVLSLLRRSAWDQAEILWGIAATARFLQGSRRHGSRALKAAAALFQGEAAGHLRAASDGYAGSAEQAAAFDAIFFYPEEPRNEEENLRAERIKEASLRERAAEVLELVRDWEETALEAQEKFLKSLA